MKVIKQILDAIFKLPPIQDRRDIRKFWVAKVFGTVEATPHKDDSYLHYQIACMSFTLCLTIGLLSLYSYITYESVHLYFYTIKFSEGDLAMDMFRQYQDITSILLLATAIFSLIKMRWNFDPANYNVFWRKINYIFKDTQGNLKILKIRVYAVTVIFMCLILMIFPAGFWGFVHKFWDFPDALPSVAFILLWVMYAGSFAPVGIVVGVAWFWHTLGKTERNNSISRRG